MYNYYRNCVTWPRDDVDALSKMIDTNLEIKAITTPI